MIKISLILLYGLAAVSKLKSGNRTMLGLTGFAIAVVLATSAAVFGERRMISIGDRRVSVYCDGDPGRSRTVILIPAGESTAKDWAMVQPAVSGFSRVCSFDHASHGESDKAPVALQSVAEVVDDLHGWLKASGENSPFILVSHSLRAYMRGASSQDFLAKSPGWCSWTHRMRNRHGGCMKSTLKDRAWTA